MEVMRAKTAGFCWGVSLALKKLDTQLHDPAAAPGRLVMLGPVIHNPLLMKEYEEQGVLCLTELDQIQPHYQVVIRAHGIPRGVEEALQQKGAVLVDATCPKVKKAQLAIGKQAQQGEFLLLFGEADHPEVKGLVSYADHGFFVFETLEALQCFPFDNGVTYFLAAQTTQDKEAFQAVAAWVSEFLHKDVTVLETICDATRLRQSEVLELARQVDAMVVVGGRNSGNTRRLAEIAAAQGTRTFHVEHPSELSMEELGGCETIGLTAGASTPDAHIALMEKFLGDSTK